MTDGAFPPPPPTSSGGSTPPPPPPPPPGLTHPPGYVAFQTAPTTTGNLSTVLGIAKWLFIITILAGIATFGASFASASIASTAQDFLDGNATEQEFLDANAIAPLVQVVPGVLTLVTAVLSVIVMYKIANNLRNMGRQTTWAPLFSIFGWVLPPMLYIIPLLVLNEQWKASDPDQPGPTDQWRASSTNPLLYVWFLVYSIIPAVLFGLSASAIFSSSLSLDTDSESLAEVAVSGSDYTIISGAVGLVGALVWAFFMKQLAARHAKLTGES